MNKITVALIVLLTACIAGGGVYFWKQAEVNKLGEDVTTLVQENRELEETIAESGDEEGEEEASESPQTKTEEDEEVPEGYKRFESETLGLSFLYPESSYDETVILTEEGNLVRLWYGSYRVSALTSIEVVEVDLTGGTANLESKLWDQVLDRPETCFLGIDEAGDEKIKLSLTYPDWVDLSYENGTVLDEECSSHGYSSLYYYPGVEDRVLWVGTGQDAPFDENEKVNVFFDSILLTK